MKVIFGRLYKPFDKSLKNLSALYLTALWKSASDWKHLAKGAADVWLLSEHSQPPVYPSPLASGLSSLAGSSVLCENKNEFNEKSRVTPTLIHLHINPAVTLCWNTSDFCLISFRPDTIPFHSNSVSIPFLSYVFVSIITSLHSCICAIQSSFSCQTE